MMSMKVRTCAVQRPKRTVVWLVGKTYPGAPVGAKAPAVGVVFEQPFLIERADLVAKVVHEAIVVCAV